MNSECARCAELLLAFELVERARLAARARFESHTTVAMAEAAAKEYRAASDAVNRALAELTVHRLTHTQPP